MARIFINYRRDDSQGVAGRLFDYLALKYSRGDLFMAVAGSEAVCFLKSKIPTGLHNTCRISAVVRQAATGTAPAAAEPSASMPK